MKKIIITASIIYLLSFQGCTHLKKYFYRYHDYCNILEKYAKYDDTLHHKTVDIVYDLKSDELIQLKNKYSLDTIGQNFNDNERLIAIMKWLNEYIAYDFGYNGNPTKKLSTPRNAQTILQNWKNEDVAIVCRDFGIALSEIYLALGYKARYITCHSVFPNDRDAHVVTEVFSRELNKWIMLDAAMNAYIKDKEGQILNLQEIRENFAKKQKLYTNKDVKELSSKQYLKYMAKNTFTFSRAITSDFNTEETTKLWLVLYPLNFTGQQKNYNSNFTITNNEKEFWD
jgi:transglutaminase-like putative cysteine protease